MIVPAITVQTLIVEVADTAGWLGCPISVSVGTRDSLIANDDERRNLRSCDVCAEMNLPQNST
jgi:hypothetical protein